MYKIGDYVVPIYVSPRAWNNHTYWYIKEMVAYTGITGKIVDASNPGQFQVAVPGESGGFLYAPEWLRPATAEEKRVCEFLFQVKG